MEIEWKWSSILAVILIVIGTVTTILSLALLTPLGHSQLTPRPSPTPSGVFTVTLVFCISYIGIGVLIFFAAIKDNKQLSLLGLIIGLIMFAIGLFTSLLVVLEIINIRPEPIPLILIAGEGLDDIPEIFQIMIYMYYGSQIQSIVPSVTMFYSINLVSSIASMTTVILAYIWFEK
ncbi:MAG: hypothetical protein ACFFCM_00550 [Promethearchaeota archaeon]